MPQESIREPRQIIDRKAIKAELEGVVAWSGLTPKSQGRILEIFKRAHRTGWDEVRRRFEDGEAGGPEATHAHAAHANCQQNTATPYHALRGEKRGRGAWSCTQP